MKPERKIYNQILIRYECYRGPFESVLFRMQLHKKHNPQLETKNQSALMIPLAVIAMHI